MASFWITRQVLVLLEAKIQVPANQGVFIWLLGKFLGINLPNTVVLGTISNSRSQRKFVAGQS